MPEEKNKKINFKILTAEHLLEEKPAEVKKIEPPPKEEIKPEVVEKIEVKEEVPPVKPIVEEKITLEPRPLTGLHYPLKEETIPPAPKIAQIIPPPPTIQQRISVEQEISYQPKKEEKPKEPRPKPELIEEEPKIFYEPPKAKVPPSPPKKIIEEKPVKEKPVAKKRFPFLNYVLWGGGALLLIFLIIFLKPYEKLKVFFAKKEIPQQEISEEIPSPTTTVIVLPKITTSPTAVPTPTETTTPLTPPQETVPQKEEPIVSQPSAGTKFFQQTFLFPTKEFSFINIFPTKDIKLQELSFADFEKQIKNILAQQETAGSLFNLNFTFNNQKIPFNFVFDYFLKPSKISSEEINNFKNEFTGNFAFMLYYTYTRKYPLLILEIKNPAQVKIFNENWEKKNMEGDLRTLFLGLEPGKPLRNYFVTKEIDGLAYRVFYFNNNYRLIWTTANNFLIYSATENGLKEIASYLK